MPIKKPHLRSSSGQIRDRVTEVRLNENPQLVVSFKLLDLHGNRKFSTSHCENGYIQKLLERLRDLNQATLNDFKLQKEG